MKYFVFDIAPKDVFNHVNWRIYEVWFRSWKFLFSFLSPRHFHFGVHVILILPGAYTHVPQVKVPPKISGPTAAGPQSSLCNGMLNLSKKFVRIPISTRQGSWASLITANRYSDPTRVFPCKSYILHRKTYNP